MSCLTTILLGVGSRVALIFWYFFDPQILSEAFKNWGIPGTIPIAAWVWGVLGFIFLPWTTLAYLFLFPGGIVGYEWIVLGVALLVDLAGHGGGYRHRRRVFHR